jgi:hypothetical protein
MTKDPQNFVNGQQVCGKIIFSSSIYHLSTTKIHLQVVIIKLLVVGYLLGGLFIDFGG